MGLWKWFKRKRQHYDISHPFWYSGIGPYIPTASGIGVDEQTSIKFLAVYDCVTLISGDVGRLPLILYQGKPDGSKDRVRQHPAYDLMHNAPNDEMTALNYREAASTHNLLWGNHYAEIIRTTGGELESIWPIDPADVEVYRSKTTGKLRYRWHIGAERRDLPAESILHVPSWGFNGLVGLSPISIARESIGLGLASDQFSSRFFSNSATPSVLLSMPPEANMDDEVAARYLKAFNDQYSGVGNAKKVMLTRNGEQVTTLTMPLKDAQFLESREFQKLEVCGMYHVPPHKIAIHGANSNYNNLEQENQSYVDSCLIHWLARYEQCFNQQLLTTAERKRGLFFEFLVDGLLRGDSESRGKFYQVLWGMGAITANEIRLKENMNPIEGGDEAMVPLNFVPASMAGEMPDNGQGKDNEPPSEDDEKEKEKKAIAWATEQRETAEKRSITARDRIIKRYRPLIMAAAQTVINRENRAIKAKLDEAGFEWLDDFYQDFAEYIRTKFGPTLRSFTGAIADVAAADTGAPIDTEKVEQFINEYVDTYVVRHVSSSRGQIVSLSKEENATELINERMDEWHEKRAEKITTRETVQGSNAVFQAVVFAAGMSTVFRIRGSKTCPYCRSLEGMRIRSGEYLVQDGDEIKPAGVENPMTFNGSKAHPPIHQGCDCYMSVI
jgi:HK97 family phage portal protein